MNRFVSFLLALFMLSFVGATSPRAISNQPQSATIPVGETAVFSVTADGEDLSYQWLKNEQDIAGETQLRQAEQVPSQSTEEGLVSCPTSQGSANPSALVTACWSLSSVNVNGKLTCIANGGGRR